MYTVCVNEEYNFKCDSRKRVKKTVINTFIIYTDI